ncbi:MAG: TonB-dependent receptor, partial [Acidobacteriaceae bacterium]|nr:TonB-dependent receptor [Acidobacteriaceae bacterium]
MRPYRCTFISGVVLILAATFFPLKAQVITATISGTVSDSSGGVVPEARVTARDVSTGLEQNTNTGADGQFTLPFLPVGTYTLRVEHAGFKTFVREGISLSVNQIASIDAQLEVGSTSDTIHVEGNASLVSTDTAQISGVVDSKRIVELPLNGRNVLQLTQLMPGVAYVNTPQSFATARFGPSLVVNGSRSNENGIYLDGSLFMDLFRGTGLNLPPPDHLQEFRAITASFSAEYGRVPGSVINAVTKSGSNAFHGALYEFLRNDALNARTFFQAQVNRLKQNQFGGAVGGPVIRNKLFFFFGYEGLRIRPAAAGTTVYAPTAAEKNGIFPTTIINPRTGLPYPNNTIPQSDLDPVSLNIQKLYIPTAAYAGQAQFFQLPQPEDNNQYTGRGDYQISDRFRLFGRYNRWKTIDNSLAARSTNVPGFSPNFNGTTIQDYVGGLTIVLSPTLVNEFRAGFHRTNNTAANLNHTDLAALGSAFPSVKNPPYIDIYNNEVVSLEPQVTTHSIGNIYQLSDDVSWVLGKHQLKFGAQAWQYRSLYRCDYLQYGYAGFDGEITGDSYADFLIGHPISFSTNQPTYDLAVNSTIVAGYIQDDFRVSPRLTLNLGARYEIQTPWYSPIKNLSQVRPGQQSVRFPTAPVGLVFEGDPGVPKGFINLDKNNIVPRIGLAYDVFGTGKTVLRAAGGIFTGQINSNSFASANSQPFNISRNFTNVTSLANPLAGEPSILPDLKTFFLPISPVFVSPDIVNPYTIAFNFQVGQQIRQDLSLEVAYVGKLGRHLMQAVDFNPAQYVPGATL